ncbi:CHAT domain-containing protein [Algoriphagus boritolerans]|uniref:CHAT domain-containing protein n=1 Tax=Algoriphagus boritolerans DSM 17298 = JCM 18970 TaxID=1120964 RepID=A0A1H5XLV3_9BACT|nr:CHAT domain-containing tetratricopeptide repeat protein [Algoriphagus boritolerans]SEG12226.1 CHAT domain-containing protein [Algoriphagus boritolerans DSM 17298 = JCM 18970]
MIYSSLAIQDFTQKNQQDSVVIAYVHQTDIFWETEGDHQAIKIANTAIIESQKLPQKNLARVAANNKKGQLLVHMAKTEEAKLSFQEAESSIPPNDSINGTVASLYNNISWMFLNLNLFKEALDYAVRSLEIQLELYGPDARQLMGVYQSLGLIANGAGWFEEAEKYSLKLYNIATANLPPSHPTMGLVHNQLVIIYESMSRYTKALFHLKAMIEVTQKAYEESGNPHFLAIAYNNTGFLYHSLGENSLAEAYFEKALRLHQVNYGDQELGIVQPLAHLAEAKRSLEKFEEADSLFTKAYLLQTKFDNENIKGLADLESQIGELHEDRQNFSKAEKWYVQALNRYQKIGVTGTTMVDETKTSLGKTYAKQGRTDEALKLHEEVLDSYRKKYQKGSLYIAGKWNRISETYRIAEDWEKALAYSDSTFLELLQLPTLPNSNWTEDLPISTSIAEFLSNRITILERGFNPVPQKEILETIVDLVRNYEGYLERSIPALRSQSSVVELAKKQKKLYQAGMNSAWLLAEQYGKIEYLETAFEFAEMGKGLLLRLASNNLMVDEYAIDENDQHAKDRNWRGKIGGLNALYLNTGGTNDTLLNELTQAIESYREFQDSLLQLSDPQWKERFNLKPFSISEIRKQLLHKDKTLIEYAVTEDYIYTFLISSADFKVFRQDRKPVSGQVAVLQNLANLDVSEFLSASFPLYQKLIEPLEPFIKGNQLIIIPDGELFGINLEILNTDNQPNEFSSLNYLIRKFEISYLLSASSAIQQRRTHYRTTKSGLFFAPGFTPGMKETYQARLLTKPEEDPIHTQLIRQPFSLKAAKEAVRMFDGEIFLEEQAQENRFVNEASVYRILHLGTHAEVNNQSPLQSRLFLAKPSLQDSVQDDGILHAFEIYNMRLEAELAVLSACNTGSGKFQEGEGIISLAHSFLYAGSASVVMSMWAIDEKASAEILTSFYSNLSKGMAKNTSLREAKLQFLDGAPDELAHPYFWGGLGLIGDPAPISGQSDNRILLLLGLFVFGVLIFFLRFRFFKKTKYS